MDELGPGERALLNALRDEDEPTDDDRRRMRAAVWARLGLAGAAATAVIASANGAAGAGAVGSVSAGAGSAASAAAAHTVGSTAAGAAASGAVAKGAAVTLLGAPLKIGLATLIVGLATGAALYHPASGEAPAPHAAEAPRLAGLAPRAPHASSPSGAPGDEAPPPAEASASAEESASAESRAAAQASASAGANAPPPASDAAQASAAPGAGAAAQASAAPAATVASRAPASRAPAPGTAAARPGAEGLDAEIALLRDAQQALQAGQFAQALSKLNEHGSRYPRGVLSTEREASRAIALCRSGRAAAGRAIAAKLLAQSPGSPLATRVRAACGQEE
ncbi:MULTISPECIES: hypothetical protein [Sorangium]|uniref:Uncharacterized protein n=1 Tax=Sorangium cellulosum TaxID=56 RepID=A0A4P2QJD5_SORCE|nr:MULTISPECIES: hypothetical protein [Sorangium]AUX29798.1 hypothetical protein SOCE836_018910 [Sorangium cellulosum]WCQ89187.1 hypothetical protein NQZ70_01874 [Sorangium sp. Soce836]